MLVDNYYTIGQTARLLGVTRQTIHRWLVANKIKGERVGRETLIQKTVLADSINKEIEVMQFVIDGLKTRRDNLLT